jgi:hypothetical protein
MEGNMSELVSLTEGLDEELFDAVEQKEAPDEYVANYNELADEWISNSALTSFMVCGEAGRMKYIDKIRESRGIRSTAGSGGHKGREVNLKQKIVSGVDLPEDEVMDAAREAGATGATVIHNARGEGLKVSKTFFGLTLETQRDVLLFLVEEHRSRHILEEIARAGSFDEEPGTGIAFQIDVEDAMGVAHQMEKISENVEELL